MRTLSKSDFKLARTCDAKLYFRENGYPDNSDRNSYLALLAEGGYMVEALAKAMHPDGVQLQYGRSPADDYAETVEHLKQDTVTLFEATLVHGRRQARVDILEKKGNVIRLLEVKAKSFDGVEHMQSIAGGMKGALWTARKPYRMRSEWVEKFEDVTFQTILLQKLRPDLVIKSYLVLVDKSKRSELDNIPGLFEIVRREQGGQQRLHSFRFTGSPNLISQLDLVTELDVSDEVALLRAEIDEAASRYESLLDAPLSAYEATIHRGAECGKCEFRVAPDVAKNGFAECWGALGSAQPHVLELYKVSMAKTPDRTPLVESMLANNTASLLDVPLECFEIKPESPGANGNRQRRQIEYTRDNAIYCSDDLRREVASLAASRGPMYFIDFETSRLALPYHKGMRPYGLVAFQWSCHSVATLGAEKPAHAEWLNMVDVWPNQSFAESLRAAIGDDGPVLTWSAFEGTTLKQIEPELSRFGHESPELTAWMHDVVERRIVDLHAWARCHYYNPGMRGRTSIKVVLDALWRSDPAMRAQFAEWTGLSADNVLDPYNALPPVEIAGKMQDVHEGTGAMRAYQEMMYGADKNDLAVKEKWASLLRQYCSLDTLSMVLILDHWRRLVASA